MQCRLIRDMEGDADADFPTGTRPVGTVLAAPPHRPAHIVLLVQMGCAEPADEECDKAAGMTPERMEAAKAAYERVTKGIHPDDYELFDAGLIAGYRPDGSYIPGPNAESEEGEESALWIPEDFGNG